MEVTFETEALFKLYTEGVSTDRVTRMQPHIIKRYQKAVDYLRDAPSIESLWQIKSLHYEKLKGNKKERSSVKINDQYRLEFIVTLNNEKPILTICHIMEISNHYQ